MCTVWFTDNLCAVQTKYESLVKMYDFWYGEKEECVGPPNDDINSP